MRPAPLSPAAMARHGWTRVDSRPRSKLRARWVHASGWRLEHCGHPTALYPWALYDQLGHLVCTGVLGPAKNPAFGMAWGSLREAVEWLRGHGTEPMSSGWETG